MQKHLLPLLFLLLSQQAYSETTLSNEDTNHSQAENAATTTKDDTQANKNLSDNSQTESSVTSEPITESDTSPQKKSNINNEGIDEDLIAELLQETKDENESAQNNEPVEPAETNKTELSPQNTSNWLPEIEFGYRSEQGNEDERSLNARLSLSYIVGRLRNTGEIKVYLKDEDGEEDERDQSYQLQSDYKISPKMYIYGNFKGIDSKYSSYFHDYTFSTGLGYQITNTDSLTIETELGPGYRYQQPNTDEIDDDDPIFPDNVNEPIIRANITAKWQPFESTSLNFDGTIVSGSSNTRIDTEISIINNITEDVALKISQSRQHLSRVPNNLSKIDSIVTINILYSPK